jgi:hypothetical protein
MPCGSLKGQHGDSQGQYEDEGGNMSLFIRRRYRTKYRALSSSFNTSTTGYYVNATNGNDTNDGLSSTSPWKTLSKVNGVTFVPGDRIFLKRGEAWREALTVAFSGSAGNRILFGAYGSGPLPIINGSDIMTSWTSYSGNTWQKTGVTIEPFRVYLDDVLLTEGADRDTLNDHEWVWAADILYVRDETGDPDGSGVTIEATQRDCIQFSFPGKDYIQLENLHLKKSNAWGVKAWEVNAGRVIGCTIEQTHNQGFWIRDAGNGTPGLFIDACTFDTTGAANQAAIYGMGANITIKNTTIKNCLGRSIEFRDVAGKQSTNFLVENCIFEGNGASGNETVAGVLPSGASAAGDNSDAHSGIVRYCLFKDLQGRGIDGFFRNTQIYYNLFVNIDAGAASSGIGIDVNGPNNKIWNNTIWRPETMGIWMGNDHLAPDVQSEVRNNIIASDEALGTAIGVANDAGVNPTFSNNLYYPNDIGEADYTWKGTDYTFANWETQSSEGDGNEADPRLVNPGTDLSLRLGSPARNVGVDVGLPVDYAGIIVPQETNPAIGAYEYTGQDYADVLLDIGGADLLAYWQLNELAGSVADNATGLAARDGAYGAGAAAALDNTPSINGDTAPYFDGDGVGGDFVNIYTTSLRDTLDGGELTLSGAFKAPVAAFTDGTQRYAANFFVDNDNGFLFRKTTTNNQFEVIYEAATTVKTVQTTISAAEIWHHVALTVSATADEMKVYIDGVQVGATQTGLGVWAGTLLSTATTLGAANTSTNVPWLGWLGHWAIFSRALSDADVLAIGAI